MNLSPKAFRFVTDAINRLSNQRFVHAWRKARPDEPLTDAQADVALHALDLEIARMLSEIEHSSQDLDLKSDLTNDMMYLRSIERDLRYRATAGGSPASVG